MEIPDLYANSIFVAARGVGRRVAQRRSYSKEAMVDSTKVQVFCAGYPYERNAINPYVDLLRVIVITKQKLFLEKNFYLHLNCDI